MAADLDPDAPVPYWPAFLSAAAMYAVPGNYWPTSAADAALDTPEPGPEAEL